MKERDSDGVRWTRRVLPVFLFLDPVAEKKRPPLPPSPTSPMCSRRRSRPAIIGAVIGCALFFFLFLSPVSTPQERAPSASARAPLAKPPTSEGAADAALHDAEGPRAEALLPGLDSLVPRACPPPPPLPSVSAPPLPRAAELLSLGSAAAAQPPDYLISPLLRATGATQSLFNAGSNPLSGYKHPRFDAVVDGGTFDGVDVLFPAFAAGYDVYSFEMSPSSQASIISALTARLNSTSFTIVRPVPGAKPAPPPRRPSPHVYFFVAGLSSRNGGVRTQFNGIMAGAEEGREVVPGSDCQGASADGCVPVVRLDDVVHAEARLWLLKLDLQGHEPQALAGATALIGSRRPHFLALEWWPAGMVAQGTADGGVAALTALYDAGARCFDAGTVEGNKIPGLGRDRPSDIAAWTKAMLAAPRTPPPGGDPIGAWDDLLCTLGVDSGEKNVR